MDFFTFSKRLKMIPWPSQALFSILDGFRRAAADARHAVGAVAAPDRLAVLNRDVVGWAELGALTAAGAGITSRKGIALSFGTCCCSATAKSCTWYSSATFSYRKSRRSHRKQYGPRRWIRIERVHLRLHACGTLLVPSQRLPVE